MNRFFFKTLSKTKLIIIVGIFLNIFFAQYNLNKYDKTIKDYSGNTHNQMTKSDLVITWEYADKFREKLSIEKNFWSSLPSYDRFFLPSIIVGTYYFIIDKEIYETDSEGEKVVKSENYKFGLLLMQILIYYLSVFFLTKEIKKKSYKNYHIFLLLFLCFEPTIIQWHSSLWSESLFISMMIFLFYLLIKNHSSNVPHILVGLLVALMFAQRAVSFMYIAPVIIYYLIKYKKNILPTLLLITGFSILMLLIGLNNSIKTGNFYFISAEHQYKSYYHYFGVSIYADKHNLNTLKAAKILNEKEKKWMENNEIDLNNSQDYFKNIKYRNKMFLQLALSNPLFTAKLFIKRTLAMCHFSPTWVTDVYKRDKTHQDAKLNPKKFFNQNLLRNIFYSLVFYIFIFVGFFSFLKEIYNRGKLTEFDNFLFFNVLSISYFVLISGFWGNPKYFVPCIISLSFFLAKGFDSSQNFINKNLKF